MSMGETNEITSVEMMPKNEAPRKTKGCINEDDATVIDIAKLSSTKHPPRCSKITPANFSDFLSTSLESKLPISFSQALLLAPFVAPLKTSSFSPQYTDKQTNAATSPTTRRFKDVFALDVENNHDLFTIPSNMAGKKDQDEADSNEDPSSLTYLDPTPYPDIKSSSLGSSNWFKYENILSFTPAYLSNFLHRVVEICVSWYFYSVFILSGALLALGIGELSSSYPSTFVRCVNTARISTGLTIGMTLLTILLAIKSTLSLNLHKKPHFYVWIVLGFLIYFGSITLVIIALYYIQSVSSNMKLTEAEIISGDVEAALRAESCSSSRVLAPAYISIAVCLIVAVIAFGLSLYRDYFTLVFMRPVVDTAEYRTWSRRIRWIRTSEGSLIPAVLILPTTGIAHISAPKVPSKTKTKEKTQPKTKGSSNQQKSSTSLKSNQQPTNESSPNDENDRYSEESPNIDSIAANPSQQQFFPRTLAQILPARLNDSEVESLQSVDFTLIYSHGNACDLGVMGITLQHLARNLNCAIIAYDYPGYGLSSDPNTVTSLPNERRACAALEAVYKAVTEDGSAMFSTPVPLPRKIVLHGRSIGTAVTVFLAALLGRAKQRDEFIYLRSQLFSHLKSLSKKAIETQFFLTMSVQDEETPGQGQGEGKGKGQGQGQNGTQPISKPAYIGMNEISEEKQSNSSPKPTNISSLTPMEPQSDRRKKPYATFEAEKVDIDKVESSGLDGQRDEDEEVIRSRSGEGMEGTVDGDNGINNEHSDGGGDIHTDTKEIREMFQSYTETKQYLLDVELETCLRLKNLQQLVRTCLYQVLLQNPSVVSKMPPRPTFRASQADNDTMAKNAKNTKKTTNRKKKVKKDKKHQLPSQQSLRVSTDLTIGSAGCGFNDEDDDDDDDDDDEDEDGSEDSNDNDTIKHGDGHNDAGPRKTYPSSASPTPSPSSALSTTKSMLHSSATPLSSCPSSPIADIDIRGLSGEGIASESDSFSKLIAFMMLLKPYQPPEVRYMDLSKVRHSCMLHGVILDSPLASIHSTKISMLSPKPGTESIVNLDEVIQACQYTSSSSSSSSPSSSSSSSSPTVPISTHILSQKMTTLKKLQKKSWKTLVSTPKIVTNPPELAPHGFETPISLPFDDSPSEIDTGDLAFQGDTTWACYQSMLNQDSVVQNLLHSSLSTDTEHVAGGGDAGKEKNWRWKCAKDTIVGFFNVPSLMESAVPAGFIGFSHQERPVQVDKSRNLGVGIYNCGPIATNTSTVDFFQRFCQAISSTSQHLSQEGDRYRCYQSETVSRLAALQHTNTETMESEILPTLSNPSGLKQSIFDMFPSIERVGHIQVPVFISHGTVDNVVPFEHGVSLLRSLAPKFRYPPAWLEGKNHNDMPKYWLYNLNAIKDINLRQVLKMKNHENKTCLLHIKQFFQHCTRFEELASDRLIRETNIIHGVCTDIAKKCREMLQHSSRSDPPTQQPKPLRNLLSIEESEAEAKMEHGMSLSSFQQSATLNADILTEYGERIPIINCTHCLETDEHDISPLNKPDASQLLQEYLSQCYVFDHERQKFQSSLMRSKGKYVFVPWSKELRHTDLNNYINMLHEYELFDDCESYLEKEKLYDHETNREYYECLLKSRVPLM